MRSAALAAAFVAAALAVAGCVLMTKQRPTVQEADAAARIGVTRDRESAAGAVTADLVAGRIGVWEAADALRSALDSDGHAIYIRRQFPAASSDREAFARLAIQRAVRRVDDPCAAAALADRLEAELAAGR